jgi:hypothetical protein
MGCNNWRSGGGVGVVEASCPEACTKIFDIIRCAVRMRVNPNPHCLGISNVFFVKMKIRGFH